MNMTDVVLRRKAAKVTPMVRILRATVPLIFCILLIAVATANDGDAAAAETTTSSDSIQFVDLVCGEKPSKDTRPEELPDPTTPEQGNDLIEPKYTDEEVAYIAKTVYGEALVTRSDTEMAAVVWCILNRVDDRSGAWPDTIEGVVTQRKQFHGYNPDHPVTEKIENLVRDVLDRWYAEKNGTNASGRVLPSNYCYFWGDGRHNHFTTEVFGKGTEWDWSLTTPYES